LSFACRRTLLCRALNRGVCQIVGGVISPLLANIALHGLETAVQEAFPERRYDLPGRPQWRPLVVRYADDFVVLHQDRAVIERVREIVAAWLSRMGLELKPSKTRISHTLEPHHGLVGFDFLGFSFRHHTRDARGRRYRKGFHLSIRPSTEAQRRHYAELAGQIRMRRAVSQTDLIAVLNPKIEGWSDYYRVIGASQTLGRMDHLLWRRLWRWAIRRHSGRSREWVAARYWPTLRSRGAQERVWTFRTTDGYTLARHARPSRRHVKVAGTASPFNGDHVYWASRLGRHPQLSRTWATLLKRQCGRCAACGLHFLTLDEVIEADHRIPLTLGGTRALGNLQLLHGHCHDRKTAADGSDHQRRANTHRGWRQPRGQRR